MKFAVFRKELLFGLLITCLACTPPAPGGQRFSEQAREYYSEARSIEESNPADAKKLYDRAFEIEPGYYGARLASIRLTASISSDHNAAADSYAALMETMQGEGAPLPEIAYARMRHGSALARAGDTAGALRSYEESLQLYNSLTGEEAAARRSERFGNLNYNIGRLLHEQGNAARALDYFEKDRELQRELGLEDTPDYADTCLLLGEIHETQSDLADAAERYEEALMIYRDHGMEAAADKARSGMERVGD